MTPRWSAVIFDLDGTVVDTVPLIVASYQHAFRTHTGGEIDEARIRGWIGQPLIRSFREAAPDQADALYATYLDWNSANTERLIRSFPGVDALLGDLRTAGLRLGVATSKRRGQAEQALALTGLAELLTVDVALEDTDQHKPDPTPIRLACERLGVEPAQAVYVGDAAVDVLAGKAAGLDTIAVSWGAGTAAQLAQAAPTATAETVDDLRALLLDTSY